MTKAEKSFPESDIDTRLETEQGQTLSRPACPSAQQTVASRLRSFAATHPASAIDADGFYGGRTCPLGILKYMAEVGKCCSPSCMNRAREAERAKVGCHRRHAAPGFQGREYVPGLWFTGPRLPRLSAS